MATDLYKHKGEQGYPLSTLSAMQKFDKAYTDVFDAEGQLKSDATSEQVDALRRLLAEITQVKDNEVVKTSQSSLLQAA